MFCKDENRFITLIVLKDRHIGSEEKYWMYSNILLDFYKKTPQATCKTKVFICMNCRLI